MSNITYDMERYPTKAEPKDLQTNRSVHDKRANAKRRFKFIIRLAGGMFVRGCLLLSICF